MFLIETMSVVLVLISLWESKVFKLWSYRSNKEIETFNVTLYPVSV